MLKTIALAISFCLAASLAHAVEMEDQPVAVLQQLDKVTARISRVSVPVGESVEVGTLLVTVRACRRSLPIEPPESAAFLEIDEKKADEAMRRIFSGWMFASTPALSALEHPVYDVWVLSCQSSEEQESVKSKQPEVQAPVQDEPVPDNLLD